MCTLTAKKKTSAFYDSEPSGPSNKPLIMFTERFINITKYMLAVRVLNQEFWKILGYFFKCI